MSHPRIYLIGRPTINVEEVAKFLQDRSLAWPRTEGASEAAELVEVAGRLCYLSFQEDRSLTTQPNRQYIQNLIRKGHESVLEHASWTFVIDRVSRAFTHQLVRHRIGFSYSQLSQQYHEDTDAHFVMPEGISDHPELCDRWTKAMREAQRCYREFLGVLKDTAPSGREEMRKLRSAARSVLPNAVETAVAVTANARAWRHFFDLRGAIEGDSEMRLVSVALFEILSDDAPELFADYELAPTKDGIGSVVKRPLDS